MIKTKHYKTAKEDIIPFGQKMAFGSGHLAIQMFPAALAIFMIVLITGLKMDPFLAGLLGALPRIFDALTDLIMGYISDNVSTKWGRRKPFIFIGSIITGICFVLLWQLNPENSSTYNFVYFLSISVVYYLGSTIFSTPLIGLGYEMTPDYNERTRLMAVSQIVGQSAWVIAPWFWVFLYDKSMFENEIEAAKILSYIVGGVCMVLGIMPALFNKEMKRLKKESQISMHGIKENLIDFFKSIGKTFTCKPFLRLCGATFFIFNGFQTIAQFSWFIIVYYLFAGSTDAAGAWPTWFGSLNAIGTMFLVIPAVSYIAQKWGKRKAFIISTLISIVGYTLKWWGFTPDNLYLMFLPLPLISFGIGGLFTLMMSMTADVCDYDELKTGKRREATFGAIYWWMVKLGQSLALVLSGAVLKFIGFDQNVQIQPVDTLINLRLADIIIPVITAIMAILIMWKYNITEQKAKEIRKELEVRRTSKKEQLTESNAIIEA